jgi:CHAD domain-containing protein
VAARRCRTALQTFGNLWGAERVKRYRKYLASFADAFGVSRDLDVMVIYLREQLAAAQGERAAAYCWLLERNIERRLQEQPRLEKSLLRLEKHGFASEFVDYFSRQPVDLWNGERRDG